MGTNPDEAAGAYNVIVIDDDPVMRLVIGMIFEDDSRFRICGQAGSAERALGLARDDRRNIDLIILDDELEGQTSGVQLAPSLRQLWPHAGVIRFTADPEGAPASSAVTATVAKTAPETLLETARRIVDMGLLQHGRPVPPVLEGSRPRDTPLFLRPSPAGRRADTTRGRRRAFNGAARWVAAAAVIVAVVAASRVPAPRRIVADLAGFVADLVPGIAVDGDSDEVDPQPDNRLDQRVENPAPAGSDAGADDEVPPVTVEDPAGPSGEEHPGDDGSGAGRQDVPALDDRPVRPPAGPAPATRTPPSTATGRRASSEGNPGAGSPPAARPIPSNRDASAPRSEERPVQVTTTTDQVTTATEAKKTERLR